MNAFGDFVRKRRLSLGMSQTETARLAGMTRPYLSLVERDGRWPQKYVSGLARALQLAESELAVAAGKIKDDHQPITAEGPENYLLYRQIARSLRFRKTPDGLEVRAEIEWIDLERLMEWVLEFHYERDHPSAYLLVPSARSALVRLCHDMISFGSSEVEEIKKRRDSLCQGLDLMIKSIPADQLPAKSERIPAEIKTIALTNEQHARWSERTNEAILPH